VLTECKSYIYIHTSQKHKLFKHKPSDICSSQFTFYNMVTCCFLLTVTAALKEPIPGWVDNLNGPTGLLAGAGKGILRSIHCYREMVADLIPVDVAINLLISVAWHTATAR
jgi:hypothetical protein